ncbi:hypothetical protein VZT92_005797 [Zoarces viviparus]|uniref:Uncharacterized protein n=1 Tax=Zoarces viviparus TaxID=48416 RepID=A0AAW1FMS0_ZOAVI
MSVESALNQTKSGARVLPSDVTQRLSLSTLQPIRSASITMTSHTLWCLRIQDKPQECVNKSRGNPGSSDSELEEDALPNYRAPESDTR